MATPAAWSWPTKVRKTYSGTRSLYGRVNSLDYPDESMRVLTTVVQAKPMHMRRSPGARAAAALGLEADPASR